MKTRKALLTALFSTMTISAVAATEAKDSGAPVAPIHPTRPTISERPFPIPICGCKTSRILISATPGLTRKITVRDSSARGSPKGPRASDSSATAFQRYDRSKYVRQTGTSLLLLKASQRS